MKVSADSINAKLAAFVTKDALEQVIKHAYIHSNMHTRIIMPIYRNTHAWLIDSINAKMAAFVTKDAPASRYDG